MAEFPNLLETLSVSTDASNEGRYTGSISGDWNVPIFPSGGVTSAVALRAMERAIDRPHQSLRAFSATFVSTVQQGDVVVDVDVLRHGNRMSHAHANLRSADRAALHGHVVSAAFGEAREGFEFTYSEPPDVGSPQSYGPRPAAPPGVSDFRAPLFEQLDVRRVRMHMAFEDDWEGGSAEAIRWMRYRHCPRRADGSIDPLSLVALADTMPPAVAQHRGPGHEFFQAPSVDLSMRFFRDTKSEWFLTHAVCHAAGDGYASAEIWLWDEDRCLVAHANQLMLIRFPRAEDLIGE